jgi:hypothetical protein
MTVRGFIDFLHNCIDRLLRQVIRKAFAKIDDGSGYTIALRLMRNVFMVCHLSACLPNKAFQPLPDINLSLKSDSCNGEIPPPA